MGKGLYANQALGESLERLGPIDRFPHVGHHGAECVLTLAVGTAPTGHVQVVLCLDLVVEGGKAVMSHPLAFYPISMADLAAADGRMAGIKLGIDLRRAEYNRPWTVEPCDGGHRGEDMRLVLPGG